MKQLRVISQVVDTLKYHMYQTKLTDDNKNSILEYAKIIDDLKELKAQAQKITHESNELRYVNKSFGSHTFQVMAGTVRGFSVTIKNAYFSLHLRANSNIDKISSPIIKVEFRSSHLVTHGYVQAVTNFNDFVSKYLIKEFHIKISEIHLATDTQGYHFTLYDKFKIKTPKGTQALHLENETIESLYLQHKKFTGLTVGKGDEMIRVYNKTHEIKKNPDKDYIRRFHWNRADNYDPNEEVWRIELQLRRPAFKNTAVQGEGLLDGFEIVLNNIPTLFSKGMEKFKLMDIDEEFIFHFTRGYRITKNGDMKAYSPRALDKRLERADFIQGYEEMLTWNGHNAKGYQIMKKITQSSDRWFKNSVKAMLSTFLKHYGNLDANTLLLNIQQMDKDEIEKKGMGLVDSVLDKTLEYMHNVTQYKEEFGLVIDVNNDFKRLLNNHVNNMLSMLKATSFNFEHNVKLIKRKTQHYQNYLRMVS